MRGVDWKYHKCKAAEIAYWLHLMLHICSSSTEATNAYTSQ